MPCLIAASILETGTVEHKAPKPTYFPQVEMLQAYSRRLSGLRDLLHSNCVKT